MERQAANNDIPKWSALLIEAVNKPGIVMEAYSAFHNYSVGNQILALVQCQMRGIQPGPINTFPKWKDLGRFVKTWRAGFDTLYADYSQASGRRFRRRTRVHQLYFQSALVCSRPDRGTRA